MDRRRMEELVAAHIAAEMAGDTGGAVAMYTHDVVHDVIGSPTGPLRGPDAAKAFYDELTSTLDTETMDVVSERYGDDFCVIEHEATATVNGAFLGIPGNGRRIRFRMLHVWEFADDAIALEQIWLDGGSIAAQLTAPGAPA